MTLFIASPDMSLIEAVCDRELIINEGRLVANAPVDTLLTNCTQEAYQFAAWNVDDATLAINQERFDVTRVPRVDGQMEFEVSVDSAGFYQLTDVMERHGLELVTVEAGQPDLADVFVALTGEEEAAVMTTVIERGRPPQ